MEAFSQILGPIGGVATVACFPSAMELLLVTFGITLPSRPRGGAARANAPMAIIVPAHNEENFIGRCIASLQVSAAEIRDCQVIIVADNCADMTAEQARQAGARVLIRENTVKRGKGFALQFAFDTLMKEDFEVFLILDADSVVSPNLISEVASAFAGGADAIQCRYRVMPPMVTTRKRLMDIAFSAFNVLRPNGRSNWGLSAGILGNGFALTRQTLVEVPYSAHSIVEDLEYHLLLVESGKKVQFSDRATVYGDMPEEASAQASQRARWEGGRVRVALAWVPRLIPHLFTGNLLVAEPLLELLTIPLAYLSTLALLLCVLPITVFRYIGLFLIVLLFIHVTISVFMTGEVGQSLLALITSPAYVFWKLTRLASIMRASRPGTEWLRTPREGELKDSTHVR
jgi:cellulose synthase/poly-beta-1,6-N-acetylglucosamine synthase-like glycosyltransferase